MICSACGEVLPDGLVELLRHLLAVLDTDTERHRLAYARIAAVVAIGSSAVGWVGALGLAVLMLVTVVVVGR